LNRKHLLLAGKIEEIAVEAKLPARMCLHSLHEPLAPEGGIAVLYGSLAPGGAVVKQSAVNPAMLQHTGPAIVFECEEEVEKQLTNQSDLAW
jgi:dihydroxy-acid dehydratase